MKFQSDRSLRSPQDDVGDEDGVDDGLEGEELVTSDCRFVIYACFYLYVPLSTQIGLILADLVLGPLSTEIGIYVMLIFSKSETKIKNRRICSLEIR